MSKTYFPVFENSEFRCAAAHYRIKVGEKTLVYTYIRKNACSTFKFFIADGPYDFNGNRINGEAAKPKAIVPLRELKPYLIDQQDIEIEKTDHLIFVYREPFERIASLFRNKLVDDVSAVAIKKNFQKFLDKPLDQVSFVDFIDYIALGFENIDPHCYPQKSHLLDRQYTDAIELGSLQSEMATLIGFDLARTYFSYRHNAIPEGDIQCNIDLTDTSVAEIRKLLRHGYNIRSENFRNARTQRMVENVYKSDFLMFCELAEPRA